MNKQLTQSELIAKLSEIKGATFLSLQYRGKGDSFNKNGNIKTKKTIDKKGKEKMVKPSLLESYGFEPSDVTKVSKLTVFCGGSADYTKLINNRLKKEGKGQITFESKGLPDGTNWLVDGILLENTNQNEIYLRTYPDCTNNIPKVHYELNGETINPKEEKFEPFWASSFRKKQSDTFTEGTNQMLDNSVKPRNYILNNIISITMGGETFEIIPK